MEIELILITSILNIACFYIGAKVGQKVVNNQPIKTEIKSPIQKINEYQKKKEMEEEQKKEQIILHNIDVYDGTGAGQQDLPR